MSKKAFTLIELLTTISIIMLLASLILPAISGAKGKAKRAACVNNIKQILYSATMYSDDDKNKSYTARTDIDDQDMNYLYSYIQNKSVYVCPATKNIVSANMEYNKYTHVKGFKDLQHLAINKNDSHGMSYQVVGFKGYDVDYWDNIQINDNVKKINGARKSANNVPYLKNYHNAFGLKGFVAGYANTWLIVENPILGLYYYPDIKDNHGESGSNVGYCDSHIEWVKQRQYIYQYERSEDNGRTNVQLPFIPATLNL